MSVKFYVQYFLFYNIRLCLPLHTAAAVLAFLLLRQQASNPAGIDFPISQISRISWTVCCPIPISVASFLTVTLWQLFDFFFISVGRGRSRSTTTKKIGHVSFLVFKISYPSSDTDSAYVGMSLCTLNSCVDMRWEIFSWTGRCIIKLRWNFISYSYIADCNNPWHLFVILLCSCLNKTFICHSYSNAPYNVMSNESWVAWIQEFGRGRS
jgi:hypothetical protein